MEYAQFTALRRPVWERLERALAAARDSRPDYAALEGIALLYRQVLHDHALASSRYPGTGAAARLARLALEATHLLQRDEAAPAGGLAAFFLQRFPAACRRLAPAIGLVAAGFTVAAATGFVLAALQPGLGTLFLGPGALDGLREGRLWTESLTSTVPPAVSASGIATNNLSVAITGWAGGALAGIGSLYVTLLNGFMLGTLFAVTAHYALAGELVEFVVAHGLLELTLIVVTAGAGLGMGLALVVAEDRPRGAVLAEAGRDAVVVLLGCLPWFVVLAVVEALVSPAPALSTGVKLAIGLGLEAVFLLLAFGGVTRQETP